MKPVIGAVLALLMFAVPALAQTPAGVGTKPQYKKGPFIKRALIATGACGIGIGLSGNPATAAEIGLPILIGGNGLAYKLDRSGHPKWSAFVQTISPIGCWAHYGSHPKVKASGIKNRVQLPHDNPPSGGSGGGSTGGPSGGTGGSGSGSGSGGSTGGSGSGGGTGGTGGGSGSGGGTGGSGGGKPPTGPCTVHGGTDCGFGNGGMNPGGGHGPNPKPPTTPPGDPHTHGGKS